MEVHAALPEQCLFSRTLQAERVRRSPAVRDDVPHV